MPCACGYNADGKVVRQIPNGKKTDVSFHLHGRKYPLLLNGNALFGAYERFDGAILEPMDRPGRQGYEATCWILHQLMEQGELYNRYMGGDHQNVPGYDELMVYLTPVDYLRARAAVERAIALGFGREAPSPEPEERDMGLEELEKKTVKGTGWQRICRRVRSFWG